MAFFTAPHVDAVVGLPIRRRQRFGHPSGHLPAPLVGGHTRMPSTAQCPGSPELGGPLVLPRRIGYKVVQDLCRWPSPPRR